jgi:hypothetical protein
MRTRFVSSIKLLMKIDQIIVCLVCRNLKLLAFDEQIMHASSGIREPHFHMYILEQSSSINDVCMGLRSLAYIHPVKNP